MENKIKWLKEVIDNSTKPILVYVKHSKCDESSENELIIAKKLEEMGKSPLLYAQCYPHDEIPFPLPYWNRLYFFEPKNQLYLQSWNVDHLLPNFEEIYLSFEAQMQGMDVEAYKLQIEQPEEIEKIRKMIKTEDISKYPTKFQMTRNLLKEAWKSTKGVIQTGKLLTDAATAKDRYSLCNLCEFFNKKDSRCTKCGCFMKEKVHLKTAECPVNKW